MTTPKRPRTILAVEALLAERVKGDPGEFPDVTGRKLHAAVVMLADANREIEKLEAERDELRERLESMENIAMEQGR